MRPAGITKSTRTLKPFDLEVLTDALYSTVSNHDASEGPAVPVSGASEPSAGTGGDDRDRQVANYRRSSRRPRPVFDDKDRLEQMHE